MSGEQKPENLLVINRDVDTSNNQDSNKYYYLKIDKEVADKTQEVLTKVA